MPAHSSSWLNVFTLYLASDLYYIYIHVYIIYYLCEYRKVYVCVC